MRRRSRSFRFHLGILGALTAIPFIVAGATLATLYVNSERGATEHDLVNVAKDLSSAIDREIAGGLSTLKTLATTQSLVQGDLEAFYSQATRVAGIFPGSVVGLRQADGQILLNTARPWGTPLPKTADPILREADQTALSAQRPVVSNLFTGATTGRHYVMLDLPIMFRGSPHLLSLAIPPESILRLVQQLSAVRQDWLVVVLDGNYSVIARTRDHDGFVGRKAREDFIQKLIGGEGIVSSTTLEGMPVLDGFFRSALTGWTIVTAVPVATINRSVRQAAFAVGVAGALGLICSLLFAIMYSRYITPPIWRLRNDALAITRGEPVQHFTTGIEELNAVSETLANASASLIRDRHAKDEMIKELNHRVKNTLATVLAIARQTQAKSDSYGQFFEAFSGRIIALSRSHDALSEGEWIDVDITRLVDRVCVSVVGADRVVAKGPPVALYPRAAVTMGMALHELCTNAAKYGALSGAGGKVAIEWSVQPHETGGPMFSLEWCESGGPPASPPSSKGFGTRFIEESIRHELSGTVEFAFRPEGLVFRCRFPLWRRAAEAPKDAQPAEKETAA